VFLEAGEDGDDGSFAGGAGFGALMEEAAEFGFGAHGATQGFEGVVVEAGLVERGAGFGGFALKRHSKL